MSLFRTHPGVTPRDVPAEANHRMSDADRRDEPKHHFQVKVIKFKNFHNYAEAMP
jgi:hypothetical protein